MGGGSNPGGNYVTNAHLFETQIYFLETWDIGVSILTVNQASLYGTTYKCMVCAKS